MSSLSSDVTVTVDQTLTSIKVSPAQVTVGAGATLPLSAEAGDLFGNPMSPRPIFAWSLASGTGSVSQASGVYSAPPAAGSAVVEATSGGIHGTASVAVAPPIILLAKVLYRDSNDWKSGMVLACLTSGSNGGTS